MDRIALLKRRQNTYLERLPPVLAQIERNNYLLRTKNAEIFAAGDSVFTNDMRLWRELSATLRRVIAGGEAEKAEMEGVLRETGEELRALGAES